MLIPQETLAAAYSQEMGIRDGAPSTGFVGELCIGNATLTGYGLLRMVGHCQEWGLQPGVAFYSTGFRCAQLSMCVTGQCPQVSD